jgi:hypothetical protein
VTIDNDGVVRRRMLTRFQNFTRGTGYRTQLILEQPRAIPNVCLSRQLWAGMDTERGSLKRSNTRVYWQYFQLCGTSPQPARARIPNSVLDRSGSLLEQAG